MIDAPGTIHNQRVIRNRVFPFGTIMINHWWSRALLEVFSGKHVLLLQGPMGPFFWRLAKDLESIGAKVSKVNFCGGDALFYPRGAIAYRGTLENWPDFLADLVHRTSVDVVMLFGDCRPYHYAVRDVLRWLNAEVYVFEEGYLRPDFITVERGGVNNFSSMPREPKEFLNFTPTKRPSNPIHAPNAFYRAVFFSISYSWANFLWRWRQPHYRHHRPLNPVMEGYRWIKSGARKIWFKWRERGMLGRFTGELSKRYFLVPLQVHNDAQITFHSDMRDVEHFVQLVVESFVEHADKDHALVFKHHPMDRAYRDYTGLFKRKAKKYGLEERLFYVHDLHLPTLLDHAIGTIVVNSTVGLSSVHHGIPTMTLGDPVYNVPGLTFQGKLSDFWRNPEEPDLELYEAFRNWLLAHNQANGNFYRPLPGVSSTAGVVWPPLLGETVPPAREEVKDVGTDSLAKTGVG